jgi:hypothetical protein
MMTTVHDYLTLLPKVKEAEQHLKKLTGLLEKIYVTLPSNSVLGYKARRHQKTLDELDKYLEELEKDIVKYRR